MFTKKHCFTFFRKTATLIATPITNEITNYKEHGLTWKGDSSWAVQKMLGSVWNRKAHYHIHKTLPLVSLPSQFSAVHDTTNQFLEYAF